MNKITAKEFEKFLDEDGEPVNDLAKLVKRGDDTAEGRMVYREDIYSYCDQFFAVIYSQDNCGYWGDGERYDPEVYEVKAIPVATVEYVAV